jgi:HlyD family secretion protein
MAIKAKKKSKAGWIIGIIIVALAAAAVAAPLIIGGKGNYLTVAAANGDIETNYTFTGNVESKNSQFVMSEKMYQISSVKVKEGDKVKVDDVLFVTTQDEKIKAKTAGTVLKVYVADDDSVMAGTKLCDIVDLDNLQIVIKVDEYDLSSIKKDKEVSVNIGAIDKTITGKIASVSYTAANQNGVAYFTANVDLKKDEAVKVGMTAEARILNKKVTDVVTIPMKTLLFDEDDKPYVLIKSDDKAPPAKTFLTLGINDGKIVEVKSGLTTGQEILYTEAGVTTSRAMGGIVPPVPGK